MRSSAPSNATATTGRPLRRTSPADMILFGTGDQRFFTRNR
ncbi:hypothetical protein [Frondihabitans sucicola]|nr:hypothetical protein [Frondihabitans sucicola]